MPELGIFKKEGRRQRAEGRSQERQKVKILKSVLVPLPTLSLPCPTLGVTYGERQAKNASRGGKSFYGIP